MGMPSPKHRHLDDWAIRESATVQGDSNEVWEIGVPSKNSLLWSITLSYLFSATENDFSIYLSKLTGDDSAIKTVKKMSSRKILEVKKEINRFNPFKNRHPFLQYCKNVNEIFRVFHLRLQQYANSLKTETGEWSDDFTLNTAALFLECTIEVYFPEELESKKVMSYPKTPHNSKSKIIVFQYKNQQQGSRTESINVFRFAMTVKQAHCLKLNVLGHILKITKIPCEKIEKVKELMNDPNNHGKRFLSTILENGLWDILPHFYKSPYIALKLSEAGFETDPFETCSSELSTFCYAALLNIDPNYIRILYDFASNCGCLFDRSVRRADHDVMDNLKRIKEIMEKDVNMLRHCDSRESSKKQAVHVLNQFISFSEYQHKTASDLKNYTKEERTRLGEFQFRKQVMEIILSNYLSDAFNASLDSTRLSELFSDYFLNSYYYENIDNFTYASFFDHIYKLRLCMDLQEEYVLLRIEWGMFLVLLSKAHFSKFDHEMKYRFEYGNDKIRWEKECALQHVVLQHRNIVKNEINVFLDELVNVSDPKILLKSLKKESLKDAHALPHVADDLLISRLMLHIDAALKVSPGDDGIKAVLVIQRALQVVGESIKPPFLSSNSSSISYLLRSCLTDDQQETLVKIRNTISKSRHKSVYGRLEVEENSAIFKAIKEELKFIKTKFEIVDFTQSLRLGEAVMRNFLEKFGKHLDVEIRKAFYEKYSSYVNERELQYESYHSECLQLFHDTVSKLIKYTTWEQCEKEVLLGWLKSIEVLCGFILRNKSDSKVDMFLRHIQEFMKDYRDKDANDFKANLVELLSKYNDVSLESECDKNAKSIPGIERFYDSLNTNMFSDDEQGCIKSAVLDAYEEAEEARNKLKDLFSAGPCRLSEEVEGYMEKVLIPEKKVSVVREAFVKGTDDDKSKEAKRVSDCLERDYISRETLEENVQNMLEEGFILNLYLHKLLTKIVYQRSAKCIIYASVQLPENVLGKLELFLTKKAHLLIERLKALKSILIDEDEDISETWARGKNQAIKRHSKFLMRQNYMRDATIRASLDMAFFDCANILNNSYWKKVFGKSTDLFAGVDLRNLVAHRTNIETIGGILDEDDIPSAMIEKMLSLIEDCETIEALLKLFIVFGGFHEESFKNWIDNTKEEEYEKEINEVKDCKRWKEYLFLLPFIKM